MRLFGLQRKSYESPQHQIIDAVKALLVGNGMNLGVFAIWRKLRREKSLFVKRLVIRNLT